MGSVPGNPHRAVRVVKVVVNVGVGESGEPLAKAEKVLSMVTGQKPVPTRSGRPRARRGRSSRRPSR